MSSGVITDISPMETQVESSEGIPSTTEEAPVSSGIPDGPEVPVVMQSVTTTDPAPVADQTDEPPPPAASSPQVVTELIQQKAFSDSCVQTDVEPKTPTSDESLQTDKACVADCLCQTDALPTHDTESQATVTMYSTDVQTIIKEFGDCISQTDMSIALQKDVFSQTFIPTENADVQAVVQQEEAIMQTEHREEVHTFMQTDSPVLEEVLSQTDQSMALQVEQESQAVVEMADVLSQAVVDISQQQCQTSSSMALEADVETQADGPPTDTSQSQTETAPVTHGSMQTDQAEREDRDTQTEEPETETPPVTENGLGDTSADMMEGIPGGETESKVEAEAQTDPVTIIIGDASFLVKKLKSSASNPSKISSHGNEIEIEVNADRSTPGRRGRQSTGGTYGTPTSGRARQGARVRMPVQRSPGMRGGATRGGGTSRGHGITGTPGPDEDNGDGGRRYNCPFCTRMFEESPTLYEHIQNDHDEQRALLKKPKGREGKTIVPKEREAESEPPVLTPMVNIAGQVDEQVVNQINAITSLPAATQQSMVQVVEIAPVVSSQPQQVTQQQQHQQQPLQQHPQQQQPLQQQPLQQQQQQQVYVTTAEDHLAQQEREVAALMAARQGEVGQYAEVHQVEVDGRSEQVLVQYVQHLADDLGHQEGGQVEVAEEAIIHQQYEVQQEQPALVETTGGEILLEVNSAVNLHQQAIVTQQAPVSEPVHAALQSIPAPSLQVPVQAEPAHVDTVIETEPNQVAEVLPESEEAEEEVETTADEDVLEEEDTEEEVKTNEEPVSPLKRKRQQLEGPSKRLKSWEPESDSGEEDSPSKSNKRAKKAASDTSPRPTRASIRSARGRGSK